MTRTPERDKIHKLCMFRKHVQLAVFLDNGVGWKFILVLFGVRYCRGGHNVVTLRCLLHAFRKTLT